MVLIFLVPVPSGSVLRAAGRDKAVHFAVFLGFAVFHQLDRRPAAGRTLLISFAFAAGIELAQAILPYRSASLLDFVAGAAGAAGGVLLLAVIGPGRLRKAPRPDS
jgi:VanZ family protein